MNIRLRLYKLRFAILIDIALRLSCLAFSVAVMEHPLFPPPHLLHTLQSFLNLPPATRGPDFYKQGEPSQVLRFVSGILRTKARVRGYHAGS